MKNTSFVLLILSIAFSIEINSQNDGFLFLNKQKKIEDVSFRLINNVIIIPLEINGKKLNFILDSGVNKTIVFNSSKADTILSSFEDKYQLRGLGKGLPVSAIISKNNRLKIKNLIGIDKNLYIVLKDDFDLSSKMGITIHGVIGYDILSNLILRINYKNKKIRFYNPISYQPKKCKNCVVLPLSIFQNKPYVDVFVKFNKSSKKIPVKMLVDSGGSDAIWLFEYSNNQIITPNNFFVDFLGVGISGTVYGKRSRIASLEIGEFIINNPTVSFLDTLSTINARKFNKRNGSIGTGILKRFKVWLDYPNKRLTLQKNSSFSDSFNYNMSGLEVVYDGKVLIKEESKNFSDNFRETKNSSVTRNSINIITNYVYKFKPNYKINDVLKGSPADIAGVKKNDVLMKINGKSIYNFKLEEINAIFQEKDSKSIRLTIVRNAETVNLVFKLKKII
tara:strand:- start:18073 stop:19419 length:1347 start_codon:yes stop_codon:yes gene_type:complete